MTMPLTISSIQGDYPVSFHKEVAEGIDALEIANEAFVIVDSRVLENHGEALIPLTSKFPTLVVSADEETKSLSGVELLVSWLIEQRAVRSATLIAIGGGCIQDLVSFTAHIYYRGVRWVYLPTTLLSQADSCIGAKSGINVLPLKNQLGVLHSPVAVRICSDFLATLPDLEIASGYGEIVKLSLTSSRHFLDLLESHLNQGGIRNSQVLELVRASLSAKQEIIEEDEQEADLRRILNYGHSFGHALEAIAQHKVAHGLAVLWGIDVINSLGVKWGITPPHLSLRVRTLIRENFDFRLFIEPTASELIEMVARDKKVSRGMMNFVVLRGVGDLIIEARPLDNVLKDELTEVLGEGLVFARS